MNGRCIVGDAVDEFVVPGQSRASYLLDFTGDGRGEEERLTLRSFRQEIRNSSNVFPETHLEKCIRFVKNQLDG